MFLGSSRTSDTKEEVSSGAAPAALLCQQLPTTNSRGEDPILPGLWLPRRETPQLPACPGLLFTRSSCYSVFRSQIPTKQRENLIKLGKPLMCKAQERKYYH